MENYIAFITLSTGTKHKITEETHNQFLEAGSDDYLQLANGTTFKKSAVMEIQDIRDWVDNGKYEDYHQPYTALPAGRGFEGIINLATDTTHIEALARGLKKAKASFNRPTPQIDKFLKLGRKQYAKIKSGFYK